MNVSTTCEPAPDPGSEQMVNEGARLLVVDDEESVALTISEILRQEGFLVDTASSGSEATARIQETEYDLVLTDLRMENGDGISVVTDVRRLSPLTIAVVLTGFASVESAIASLRQGAYDYLIKPCNIDDLKHTVKRGVEHRRLMLTEQQARRDLEYLNRDLERRIDERTTDLVRLNEELSEANRVKDVFLATLSHELRTPLTPILGWVKLLRSSNLDDLKTTQALEAIERNAQLQAHLIDDLLDVSRIVTGKLDFERELADMNDIVARAVETLRSSATRRRVELEVSLAEPPAIILGAPVRLQQIVWNLLSNAIKFTEGGGRVEVRVESSGENVSVVVADSGIGIEAEFLPHVFDSFRQADSSRSRRHGGLGLGLAIVQALARLHEGTVRAESEGLGHGTQFTFTMPLARSTDARKEELEIPQLGPLPDPVLVVEDSRDTLELFRTLFEQWGCRVFAAGSAMEALALASKERPAIVITDIGMPDMDGYELWARLRNLPGMEKVTAIAISGYAMEEDRLRSLSSGFSAHLTKPIDLEALTAVIRKLANGKSPEDSSSSA
jgi:signal transduction histidine kinase